MNKDEDIREDYVAIDSEKGVEFQGAHRARFYTINLKAVLLIMGIACLSAWGGVFFLGAGIGARLCGL